MARAVKTIEKQPDDIVFFSEIDMSKTDPGKIGSTYPAWYFEEQQRHLEEDIAAEEQSLKAFNLPEDRRPVKLAKIKRMKDRLEEIKEAIHNVKPNRDRVKVMVDELSQSLSDIMYRRNDEHKGFVSPHKVAEHMSTPCIEVSPEIARTALVNGIAVVKAGSKGKMNLNDATRLWQIGRAALGEDKNPEILRRD